MLFFQLQLVVQGVIKVFAKGEDGKGEDDASKGRDGRSDGTQNAVAQALLKRSSL